MPAGDETEELDLGVPGRSCRPDCEMARCGTMLAVSKGMRLGGKAELEDDGLAAGRQGGEKSFLNIGRVKCPVRPGRPVAAESTRPPSRRHSPAGRRCRWRCAWPGKAPDVWPSWSTKWRMAAWTSSSVPMTRLAGWTAARPMRDRAARRFTPTTFQFVQSRIELSPLRSREEGPFHGVVQDVVVGSGTAARELRRELVDVRSPDNLPLPGAVVGSLTNQPVQSFPVVGGNRLIPTVQVAENEPRAPRTARVLDQRQIRYGFCEAGCEPPQGSASRDIPSGGSR